MSIFFFQAEDGIRDLTVTGVQTCALPISPARAQDLTLRHRVKDYRAGDLERRYARLPIDEDCLVNYGFLPSEHLALMLTGQKAVVDQAVLVDRKSVV